MKKTRTIFIFAAIVLLLIILGLRSKQTTAPSPADPEPVVINENAEDMSECGFTLTSPASGSSVTFPLAVTGTVNNTNATELGCSWTMFEAVAGSLTLKDNTNTTLATSYLGTNDPWMTTGPVNFSGTLTPLNPIAPGTALTLVIDEEDPSDGEAGPASVISIPLIAQ